ncbi:MAG: AraC family transcriptional regulator [Breznakibacter sp.]
MIPRYDFHKKKYGDELLIDVIRLEDLQPYVARHPTHQLTYFDITLITHGEGAFYIDGRQVMLGRGLVLFSSPGQVRSWDFREMPRGLVLIFENDFLSSFFNDALFVQKLCFFGYFSAPPCMELTASELGHIELLMVQISAEIGVRGAKDQHLLRALLYQVLMLLNRMYLSRYAVSCGEWQNRYIREFVVLVNIHGHRDRCVGFYARRLSVTAGHLNDLSKRYLGVSAKRYIIGRTLLEAKRLLAYTGMSVDEVASHLNYETTSYFIRAFRADTGQTPLAFRNQMK